MLPVAWMFISICVLYTGANPPLKRPSLRTEYEWKSFDYVWKSVHQKKMYIMNNLYNPHKFVPIDVARAPDGRTFVTIIRSPGVPASLNVVSKQYGELGPLLQPYPDWSWYDYEDPCQGIINVYRVAIDECNRMWVLDTGSIDFKYICPAKLLVFNLQTNSLIFWQEIDDKVAYSMKGPGLLITPIVETNGSRCEDTTVYIGDVTGHGLIVWHNLNSTRLEEPSVFGPDLAYTNHSIADDSFVLDDGILGMALSPKLTPDGHRYLLFRPFASKSMFAADTRDLKCAFVDKKIDYIKAKNVLPSPASAQAFASDGTLFYGLTKEIAIGCWNIQQPMLPENFKIALVDKQRLQFASGMKVFRDPVKKEDEYLIVMTNRLQQIWNSKLDIREINFRVLLAPVKELVAAGHCTA